MEITIMSVFLFGAVVGALLSRGVPTSFTIEGRTKKIAFRVKIENYVQVRITRNNF